MAEMKRRMSEKKPSYKNFYETISRPVRHSPQLMAAFRLCYFGIPRLTAVVYGLTILFYALSCLKQAGCAEWLSAWHFDRYLFQTAKWVGLLKIVLVPMTGFLTISLLRKGIDAPRPYIKYAITPLIQKKKEKESFPSRHTFSITVIAMCCLYCNVCLGTAMLFLAVILGVTRIAAGVHFVKDVAWAYCIAVVWGIIGLWIL